MKFRVYQPTEKKETYLKLIETSSGIDLVVVSADGSTVPGGNILTIGENGIRLHTSVVRDIGFPCNANGTVIII